MSEIDFNLSNINEIKNFTFSPGSINQTPSESLINKYLKGGWKILSINPAPHSAIVYSLGWCGDEDAPHFEEDPPYYGEPIL